MNLYDGHRVEDHEDFLLYTLLPEIFAYAKSSNTPTEIVASAAFLCLATTLQANGLPRDTIIAAINAARLPTHDAPAVLQ